MCFLCKRNHADCLHHIISPSSVRYVQGKHNESIFNSCPLNNFECHIGKTLHTKEMESLLLKIVFNYIMENKNNYKFSENDIRFLEVYKDLYL